MNQDDHGRAQELARREREHKEHLVFWGPLGILLFGGGGAVMVLGASTLSDPAVIVGGLCGLVPVARLVVLNAKVWNTPLSDDELDESWDAYSATVGSTPSRRRPARRRSTRTRRVDMGAVGRWIGGSLALMVVMSVVWRPVFFEAFLWTFSTGAAFLAYALMLGRRGLSQRPRPAAR